jgi:hypothetical protein
MGNSDTIIAKKENGLPLSNMGKKYHISQTSVNNLLWKMLLEIIACQIAT